MKGVFDKFGLKVGQHKEIGEARISAFEVIRKNDPLHHMRLIMDGMPVYDGKYIKLHVGGQLMMSDTDMEKSSNRSFCIRANGDILIAGLGIGLVLKNIWDKLSTNNIKSITVIENSSDVISLVSPYFKHKKINIIHDDITEWRPARGVKFDTIYFDIWPEICTDNLKEITFLHNSFKSRLNRTNPNCFMNSWMKEHLQKMNRKTSYYW